MKIIYSDVIGFCPGVNEAVYACKKDNYCLGEVIHNSETIERLKMLGTQFIEENDIYSTNLENEDIVIRAHGVEPKVYKKLKDAKANIIDKTCPNVKKAQILAGLYPLTKTIVIGDVKHPEIWGVLGNNPDALVFSKDIDEEAIKMISSNLKNTSIHLIGQTTLLESTYNNICKLFKKYHNKVLVSNTLCPETKKRQKALKKLCKKVDFIIIVGDKKSSNTNQLKILADNKEVPSIIVNNAHELNLDEISNYKKVGIAGGASTPRYLLEEVYNMLAMHVNVLYNKKVNICIK